LNPISIIIPIRNEENYIKECIESIINFDYPKEALEILFIDGMSKDSTLNIIKHYQEQYPYIKVIENRDKIVPTAMNLGIKEAKGDYICRLDAHASYPRDYISKLLEWSQKLDADNVGAVCKTSLKSSTNIAKAIQFVMSDKFGVGNSLFRIGVDRPLEVDTVPFGFYKKEVFEKIGGYNEKLVRVQDLEMNKRLKRDGGKIFLVPDIECTYYPRETLKSFWQNRFKTGKWIILAPYFTNTLNNISLRHITPLIFLLISFLLILLSLFNKLFIPLLTIFLLFYSIILFARALILTKDSILSFNILVVYATLHFGYGLGSFISIMEIFINKRKGVKK